MTTIRSGSDKGGWQCLGDRGGGVVPRKGGVVGAICHRVAVLGMAMSQGCQEVLEGFQSCRWQCRVSEG